MPTLIRRCYSTANPFWWISGLPGGSLSDHGSHRGGIGRRTYRSSESGENGCRSNPEPLCTWNISHTYLHLCSMRKGSDPIHRLDFQARIGVHARAGCRSQGARFHSPNTTQPLSLSTDKAPEAPVRIGLIAGVGFPYPWRSCDCSGQEEVRADRGGF